MSKYTRSNKINHYHERSSTKRMATKQQQQQEGGNCCRNNRLASSSSISNIISVKCLDEDSDGWLSGRPQQQQQQQKQQQSTQLSTNKTSLRARKTSLSSSSKQLAFIAFFTLASVLVLAGIQDVSALNCYHCSSVNNPDCDEAFTGRANFTDTDCEKHIGKAAKVCRKIVQYIEDKKVVIRSCGFIDEHEGKEKKAMCYKRSGTFAIMMESCNCYEDNCNHSASLVPSKSLLFSLISLFPFALLYLKYC